MHKRTHWLGCLLLAAVFIFAGCSEGNTDKKTIRLAHALSTSHPVHIGMERMAKLVDEKSNGQLEIAIFPSQQLGSERETLELLQIGSIGMTKVSSAALENFVPELRVYSLPYLFQNDEHALNVLNGEIGRELLLAGEEYWLRGLTYYDAGYRSFYTVNQPVESPEDLQGQKIRVMESQMSVNMVRELGGSPTPISFGELYTALQQGVVDGAENNPPSFLSSRHYEVAKYYSLDEHLMLPDLLLISTLQWDNLSEQEQKWIQEAADSSANYQRQVWAEAEEEAMEIVKEAGVEVIYPDKQPFIELTEPIYDQYRETEPEFFELIQRIKDENPNQES
ncbi:TRAP transporter substrate-binding protein [Gracilimonas mengyeensis]|uniref:Tripartite ATP-independent transporter solute receptor, DctP family n=1 Tax=Gracilimonas mengyeensis TaxID=1302730 RepID=A0A521FDM6_9BACT|nr:TRAP transporter substrate-binding protein [Gracilimonas mengyeensis]SMO94308.1 tripartite ATP-independent transporter solute receptor, DctP family [Gracilimonas mengyeensis]